MNCVWSLFCFSLLLLIIFPASVTASDAECIQESPHISLSGSINSIKVYAGVATVIDLGHELPEATAWYVDGREVQSGENASYCLLISHSGQHILEVRRAFNNSTIRTNLESVSYNNIQLTSITPKTTGETQESFTLSNRNAFFVYLKNWSLRSLSSKTRIPVTTDMQPNGTMTIKTNNRLNNSGGTYGLYNESDQLIDIVTYNRALEGEVIHRDGIFWPQRESKADKSSKKTENSDDKTDTAAEVDGIVVDPNGRIVDIRTDTGESIRIVLHPSYKGEKPRLHRGDRIAAIGIWKRSKRGWYVSVREGHTFTLLYELNRRTLQNRGTKIIQSALNQTPTVLMGNLNHEQKMVPVVLSQASLPFFMPSPLWWMVTIIVILSSGLTLPLRREKFI